MYENINNSFSTCKAIDHFSTKILFHFKMNMILCTLFKSKTTMTSRALSELNIFNMHLPLKPFFYHNTVVVPKYKQNFVYLSLFVFFLVFLLLHCFFLCSICIAIFFSLYGFRKSFIYDVSVSMAIEDFDALLHIDQCLAGGGGGLFNMWSLQTLLPLINPGGKYYNIFQLHVVELGLTHPTVRPLRLHSNSQFNARTALLNVGGGRFFSSSVLYKASQQI